MFALRFWCIFGVLFIGTESKFNRCYTCRSRTDLGDCGDPFHPINISSNTALNEVPCSTGWCMKMIDGIFDSKMAATERSCLVRPPSDGAERCADVVKNNRPVYMCFCRGDLCNGAAKPGCNLYWSAVILAMVVILCGTRV